MRLGNKSNRVFQGNVRDRGTNGNEKSSGRYRRDNIPRGRVRRDARDDKHESSLQNRTRLASLAFYRSFVSSRSGTPGAKVDFLREEGISSF